MAALNLSDDLLDTAKRYAATQSLSVDAAVAILINLGLERASDQSRAASSRPAESPAVRFIDGFGEFVAPPGTPILSTDELLRIEDEY